MGNEISQCVDDLASGGAADITDNADKDQGELAAGYLYQRSARSMQSKVSKATGASSGKMMKKHWFVLKGWPDCTLTSYKDRFAEAPNGVTHLLRADVKPKQQEDDKFHFSVHHSSNGTKHLFAEDSHTMHRWIQMCTDVVNEATDMGGMEGFLKKRGGIRLHTWQQRWFMLMGNELCWYEKASDSFPRGSIMLNPQIIASECEKDVGGEKYVFQIVDTARHDSKREREFACETMTDRKFWVQAMNQCITNQQDKNRASSRSRGRSASPEPGEGEGEEGGGEARA
ncbi:hypothetical protein TeGR_g9859, partial [Tetraparma gracilis]